MIAALRYGRCSSSIHCNGPSGVAVGGIGELSPRNIGDDGCVSMTAATIDASVASRHNTTGRLFQAERSVVTAGRSSKNGKTTNGPRIKNRKNRG